MALASQFEKEKVARIWGNADTFATALLVLFIDEFGMEALDWEPETILMEIHDSWGVRPPQANVDRLLSLIAAIKTDAFYQDPVVFMHTCNALSGAPVDFDNTDPVEPEEAAWALTEVGMLQPPKSEEEFTARFSDEVRTFVGAILDLEGIRGSPDVLYIAIREPKSNAGAFSDDPSMFTAFYQKSDDLAQQIRDSVKSNARELYAQLRSLPLQQAQQSWQAFLEKYRRWSMTGTNQAAAAL